jgi:hypothetical protein
MKNLKIGSILNTTLFLFLLFSVSAFAQENRGFKIHLDRYALVIGNSAYQTVPLKNPINDAEDMTATLKKMGFTVILKKNADQRTMEDTIRYFGKQLRGGGVGLFYFAGHGMQVDGRNYLIPINAEIESESDVKYEAVDAGRVLGKMADAENQINIIILDACRNNPFSRNFRTSERGLARMDAPKGSIIAYATAPGAIAADGPDRNGIFTKYLIKHMIVPNLPIELVLKQARIEVARATGGRQIPWESSSLMGNFYFKSEKSAIKTKIADESKIPSKSVSETQIAAISDDDKRKIEPWTGIWDVQYFHGAGYRLVLKQNGRTVKSTNDSRCKFSGTIEKNTLKGWIEINEERISNCSLKLSSDNQSFKGSFVDLKWELNDSFLWGKRRK